MKPTRALLCVATLLAFCASASLADTKGKGKKKAPAKSVPAGSEAAKPPASLGALEDEVNDRLSMADEYRAEGISPQEILEVKELLDMDFPDTAAGANLKARVYVELSRIYARQGISPSAIKLLQDGIVDLGAYRDAEIQLREGLVEIYRDLGFAPQAIREHKRIRQLRRGNTDQT